MPEPKTKPKPIGRPKLPKGHAKSTTILVRMSAGDRKGLERAAKAKGQTVSHFIREMINAAL